MTNLSLANKSLEEILSESIFSTPAISIKIDDLLSEVVCLLPHYLESYTDSLVVTRNDEPVGIIGGIEVLDNILKNPTAKIFDEKKIADVMNVKITIMNPKDRFSDLVKQWSQTKRAFAIIPNQYHGYSAISARKILDVGIAFKINTTLSAIPRKNTITFQKEDTVKRIIEHMFENKTRKLVLKGTKFFINDRIIIEKLTRDFNCLRNGEDFLSMKSDIFKLEEAKNVSDDLSISEACRIMQDMKSPYLMINEKVVSPWDIVLALSSENLSQM